MVKLLAGTVVILLILLLLLGNFLANLLIKPKRMTMEEGINLELTLGTTTKEEQESLKKEPFSLRSKAGYLLKGEWLITDSAENKVMIICHGFQVNRSRSYQYAMLFLKRGFQVCVYDHVHSGDSEGKYTTMGYLESDDLMQITDMVLERFGKEVFIGTHGESMGGATVLLHMCRDERVRFVIADCPFADLKEQAVHVLRSKVPCFLLPLAAIASIWVRIKAGFWIKEVSPLREIQENQGMPRIPLLLIHGTADDFIPCESSLKLRDAKKGLVSLYLCEGAGHAKNLITNRKGYEKAVDDFLEMIAEK